jgi:hypothetical protein
MLKKSVFSPAQPWRAKTRLSPRFVLATAQRTTWGKSPWRRTRGGPGEKRVRFASSLAAASLEGLSEHPEESFSPSETIEQLAFDSVSK